MHLLIIPSYYPNTYNSIDGIYFKVQAEALMEYGLKVGVVAPVIIKYFVLLRKKKIDFGYKISNRKLPVFMCQVPSFPVFKRMNEQMRLYFGKKLFKKYVSEYGVPDMVHLHAFENGILTKWIKENYGIDYVVTEHSTGFSRNRYPKRLLALAKKTYEHSLRVITVSPTLQQTLKNSLSTESIVIPNMVDTTFFTPQKATKQFDFISVGGLRDTKNFELLIRAFHKINEKKTLKLAIIGVGPLEIKILELIAYLEEKNNIFLLGKKDPSDVRKHYTESSVFVSSSTHETFGVAIIEAMSCGLPAVCTRSGGPEYFITSPEVGMLTDHTVSALSDAMAHYLSIRDTLDQEKIRDHIVNRFSKKSVCSRIVKTYQQA